MTSPSTITKHGVVPAKAAATSAESSKQLDTMPLSRGSLSQSSVSSKVDSQGNSEAMSRNGSVTSAFGDYFAAAATTDPPAAFSSSSAVVAINDADKTSSNPWSNLFAAQQVPPTPAAIADGRNATVTLQRPAGSDTFMKNGTTPNEANSALRGQSAFAMPLDIMQRKRSGSSIGSAMTGVTKAAAETTARFEALDPAELKTILLSAGSTNSSSPLSDQRSETLILDIRPSTAFAQARIQGSINICAPSTLLKRAGVTIERIEDEMLQNETDQARFSGWRKGPIRETDGGRKANAAGIPSDVRSIQSIVVLDTDTRNIGDAGKPSSGGGGPCLTGLLKKFDLAGFDGRLRWLVGGFNDFAQHVASALKENASSLIERNTPPVSQAKEAMGGALSLSPSGSDWSRRASAPDFKATLGPPGMRLPPLQSARSFSLVQPKGLPMEAFMARSTAQGKAQEVQSSNAAQYAMAGEEGGQGSSQEPNLSAANPFFDNIRQNKELQNGVTERIPLSVPEMSESEVRRLPGFLTKLRRMSSGQRASTLAQSFFEIEQQERDRLMAVMQRHAEESDCTKPGRGGDGANTPSTALLPVQLLQLSSPNCAVDAGKNEHETSKNLFPFSIAAALERGSENRYNNIWTYEHSRVRCPMQSDYLNGSFVEPARQFGCKRRYIATQAPLPATFDTFWSVMWQQNVRTICMVTREFESGRVQSHNYWSNKQYGNLTLEFAEEVALDKHGNVLRDLATERKVEEPGNYFGTGTDGNRAKQDDFATIRRRFTLSNRQGERRTITQFQYIEWPDYSVPDNPDGLLVLMRLANASQLAAGDPGPLVVHCSAGVGRTGTYITIDSALDSIRRARWASAGRPALDVWEQGWVDVPERGRERVDDLHPQAQVEQFRLAIATVKSPLELGSSSSQRRNLKRELSPSAMDLDSPQRPAGTSGIVGGGSGLDTRVRSSSPLSDPSGPTIGRDIDSPPPARRSRPDEAEDPMGSANGGVGTGPNGKALPNSQSGHLPFSLGNGEGPQTPSSALSRLSLLSASGSSGGSASAHQPTQFSQLQHGDSLSSSSSSLLSNVGNKVSHDSSAASVGTTASTHVSDAPSSSSEGGDNASRFGTAAPSVELMDVKEGVDVVRKIADTIREQRMSMIQTTRQFVFAYAAVFQGVLEEMRREEAALERRLSSSS